METARQFRRYDEECQAMARLTRDPQSSAGWTQLAERWAKCAEIEDSKKTAFRPPRPKYRH